MMPADRDFHRGLTCVLCGHGTVSIPGAYVGMGDRIPLGAAMNKGRLTPSRYWPRSKPGKPIELGRYSSDKPRTHPSLIGNSAIRSRASSRPFSALADNIGDDEHG